MSTQTNTQAGDYYFLSLSEKLEGIFKLTCDRINQISESFDDNLLPQIQPTIQQLAIPIAISHPSELTTTKTVPLPYPASVPPLKPHPPSINSSSELKPELEPKHQSSPRTPPTPSVTLQGISESIESERNPKTSSYTPPPHCITSPRDDPEGLPPIKQEEANNHLPSNQRLPVPPNPVDNRKIPLNLLERIASPPPPPTITLTKNPPDPTHHIGSQTSQSSQSAPIDVNDSHQVTPNDQLRTRSPVSSSYRRTDDSTFAHSSKTRFSSRSPPSSKSSHQRDGRDSFKSPSRRESNSGLVGCRPCVYDSYKPAGLNPPTRRPRSRSSCRRSRSPGRRSRSTYRRPPSPYRPSRSPYRRTSSPSRRSRSPSRRNSESSGSRRPTNTRFIDRIETREAGDFAEYLNPSRGEPSYDTLKSILRSLHAPGYFKVVVSHDLWETFRRFRRRADTREERMLRHLHLYPELMHQFLICARERRIITYRPVDHSLSRSTIKLDVSFRLPIPRRRFSPTE